MTETKTERKLVPARRAKRIWTPEEEAWLQDKWGTVSIKGMARRLGRSENAIVVRGQRLGCGAHLSSDYRIPLQQLMTAIYGYKSTWTIAKRLMDAGMPVKMHRVKKSRFRVIDLDDFWKWAKDNKSLLNFSRFEPHALGPEPDWVADKRRFDQITATKTRANHNAPWTKAEDARLLFFLQKGGYTYQDLRRELRRSEDAIKRRIKTLDLKERPAKCRNRKWTEDEVELLLSMIEAGVGWIQISEKLGRNALAVKAKYERLRNPEYMKRYNRGKNKDYEYTGIRDITPDEVRRLRSLTRDVDLDDAPPPGGRRKH